MKFHAYHALLCISSFISTSLAVLDYAVSLTDSTFEHQTQASTGQTTGNWLIQFYAEDYPVSPSGDTIPTEEDWLENHVVLATVDFKSNPALKERFGSYTGNQNTMWLYLHKKGLSAHPVTTTWQQLMEFTVNPGPAVEIPPPKSTTRTAFDWFEVVHQNAATLGLAFGVLGVRLLVWLVKTYAGDNAHQRIHHTKKRQ